MTMISRVWLTQHYQVQVPTCPTRHCQHHPPHHACAATQRTPTCLILYLLDSPNTYLLPLLPPLHHTLYTRCHTHLATPPAGFSTAAGSPTTQLHHHPGLLLTCILPIPLPQKGEKATRAMTASACHTTAHPTHTTPRHSLACHALRTPRCAETTFCRALDGSSSVILPLCGQASWDHAACYSGSGSDDIKRWFFNTTVLLLPLPSCTSLPSIPGPFYGYVVFTVYLSGFLLYYVCSPPPLYSLF